MVPHVHPVAFHLCPLQPHLVVCSCWKEALQWDFGNLIFLASGFILHVTCWLQNTSGRGEILPKFWFLL